EQRHRLCRVPEGERGSAKCRQRLRHPGERRAAAVLGGPPAGQDGGPSDERRHSQEECRGAGPAALDFAEECQGSTESVSSTINRTCTWAPFSNTGKGYEREDRCLT